MKAIDTAKNDRPLDAEAGLVTDVRANSEQQAVVTKRGGPRKANTTSDVNRSANPGWSHWERIGGFDVMKVA
jgi:hypothetical protein